MTLALVCWTGWLSAGRVTSVYFDWLQNCMRAQDVLAVQHIPPLPLDPVWGGVCACLLKHEPLYCLAGVCLGGITVAVQPALPQKIWSAITFSFLSYLLCSISFWDIVALWVELASTQSNPPASASEMLRLLLNNSDVINIVFFSYWLLGLCIKCCCALKSVTDVSGSVLVGMSRRVKLLMQVLQPLDSGFVSLPVHLKYLCF